MIGSGFWRSRGARFFMMLILTAVMAIPLMMIGGITWDRESYSRQTVREIGSVWGGEQLVAGPFLVIPVDSTVLAAGADGEERVRTLRRHAVLTPETLDIAFEIATETRSRGIYNATVYTAETAVSGQFGAPNLETLTGEGDRVLWDKAAIEVHVSDPRAFADNVTLDWNGETHAFEPGRPAGAVASPDPRFPDPVMEAGGNSIRTAIGDPRGKAGVFAFALTLKGSGRLAMAPLGKTTEARMIADWPHPSFDGAFLPEDRSVSESGFTAAWSVPYLARGFPAGWIENTRDTAANAGRASFGVSFYQPVNLYQKVQRALKYAVLIVGLTFLTIFLIENATGVVTHSVQYLLVGLAQCVFFLLLLALTEHMAFATAYLSAAGATILLITAYAATALRTGKATWTALASLITLYGFLYLLLESRDYALLIGAIAAFLTIAATMYATRNVDWWTGSGEPR